MTYPPGQHALPQQSHGQPNHHHYDQQSLPQQPPGWQPPPPQQPPGWQVAPPPPPQQYGWQPAPPPSPQSANKGGKAGGAVGTILAIVAAVWLIGQAGSDSDSSSAGPGQDTAAVDEASTDSSGPAPKGSAVRDGKIRVHCTQGRLWQTSNRLRISRQAGTGSVLSRACQGRQHRVGATAVRRLQPESSRRFR